MLFSIVVLSYNRPEQIERILNKMQYSRAGEFNLIIKDDCSPRKEEIEEIVNVYREILPFEVVFYSNDRNLGYDGNLLDSFNITNSKYIFLLSDDDYIDGNHIADLSKTLTKGVYKFYFAPYNDKGQLKRFGVGAYQLNKFHEVIYNSILFSGLIFDRQAVLNLKKDFKFLSDCIYSQVYLSSVLIYEQMGFGEVSDNILFLGGDGENYFGKNQSAINKDLLQDRVSIGSNLKYQLFLLNVVERISKDTHPIVKELFYKQYNLRLVGYLMRARMLGVNAFVGLAKELKASGIATNWLVKFSIGVLLFFPGFICAAIHKFAVRIFRTAG